KNINEYKITAGKSITPNSVQQIKDEFWEYAQFDPVKDGKKVECWEHTFFDPAKEDERTECGNQISADPATQLESNSIQQRRKQYDPKLEKVTDTSVTYDSFIEEVQDIWIKYLLEEHQCSEGNPIGGRLCHFIDAQKWITADTQVTRVINTFWIDTQAHYLLEINITNIMKIRSSKSELALGKLIQKEIRENIIEDESATQQKCVNPCFAIPKSVPGKWRKNTNCSLLNKFRCATHSIIEDFQNP
ncbi:MAG: hypothetical protein EZS28_013460, partial [Streblomastix strix]